MIKLAILPTILIFSHFNAMADSSSIHDTHGLKMEIQQSIRIQLQELAEQEYKLSRLRLASNINLPDLIAEQESINALPSKKQNNNWFNYFLKR